MVGKQRSKQTPTTKQKQTNKAGKRSQYTTKKLINTYE